MATDQGLFVRLDPELVEWMLAQDGTPSTVVAEAVALLREFSGGPVTEVSERLAREAIERLA